MVVGPHPKYFFEDFAGDWCGLCVGKRSRRVPPRFKIYEFISIDQFRKGKVELNKLEALAEGEPITLSRKNKDGVETRGHH